MDLRLQTLLRYLLHKLVSIHLGFNLLGRGLMLIDADHGEYGILCSNTWNSPNIVYSFCHTGSNECYSASEAFMFGAEDIFTATGAE